MLSSSTMQTFRQTEEIIKTTAKNMPNHPTSTSYSHINRRVNNLDTVSSRSSNELDGDNLTAKLTTAIKNIEKKVHNNANREI